MTRSEERKFRSIVAVLFLAGFTTEEVLQLVRERRI